MQFLGACPLFARLPAAEIGRLASSASVRRYRRGQLVFSEGDAADTLLVICEGSLKAVSTSMDGDEFLLAVVGPLETLGELTVADGGPRSASVTAITEAVALSLPRRSVLEVAAGSPLLQQALLVAMATVIRRLTGAAADMVFLDIPRRVAKLVLTLPGSGAQSALTQSEMANRVGASRQSLNAALQDFQRRGWITVSGRAITVLDAAPLRAYVGG